MTPSEAVVLLLEWREWCITDGLPNAAQQHLEVAECIAELMDDTYGIREKASNAWQNALKALETAAGGHSHKMPCNVMNGVYRKREPAVIDLQSGVFHPSWAAQRDGWFLIRARSRWQRFVCRLIGVMDLP